VGSAAPLQFTLDEDTKPLPLTVSVNAAPPAEVLVGASAEIAGTGLVLVMFSVDTPDVPPPGAGVLTVTLALPLAATLEAGTDALSLASLTKVVVRAAPFQFTLEDDTKPLPSTDSVNAALPAVTLAGASAEIVGTRLVLVIVNVDTPDLPPPGAGLLTVTLAVPALATSAADTDAVSLLLLTKVVASAAPFQLTAEEDTKLPPLTVSVNAVPPAVTVVGATAEIAGTGLVLVILRSDTADVPPPGAGLLTVTLAVPALAMSEAETEAVRFVSLI